MVLRGGLTSMVFGCRLVGFVPMSLDPRLVHDFLVVAFLVAADGDKDDHHILQGCRYRVLQDIFQHIPAIAQAQIVEKGTHDRRMPRIANRAVIESADLPFEGVAKGSRRRPKC